MSDYEYRVWEMVGAGNWHWEVRDTRTADLFVVATGTGHSEQHATDIALAAARTAANKGNASWNTIP